MDNEFWSLTIQKQEAEQKELEKRKLLVDLEMAENVLKDYPATKKQAKWAIWISFGSFLAAVLAVPLVTPFVQGLFGVKPDSSPLDSLYSTRFQVDSLKTELYKTRSRLQRLEKGTLPKK